MGNLTDVQLRNWIKAGVPLAKADGNGLTFTLSPKGTAAWVLRYRYGGKARELSLGRYPDISLAEARKQATAKRAEVQQGVNVAHAKQMAKLDAAAAVTVKALAEEWMQREIENRIKHPNVVRRVLDRYVVPKIGSLAVEEVRPAHIDKLLQAIIKADAPTVANDALRHIKRMFTFARKRHWVEFNPVADFTAADAGGTEQQRDRFLSQTELAALFKAMQDSPNFGRQNELAVTLLLLLCVRKMELLAAQWSEFDLAAGVWELPGERTKTGKSIRIPLPALAVDCLTELRVFACGSSYVFPARRVSRQSRFPHVSPDTLNMALKHLVVPDVAHFTVHDLRRTARTQLAGLGVSSDIAERALNHQIKGVEGRYNRHDYFEERRTALNLWANFLQACIGQRHWNVTPLRQSA